MDSYNRSDPLDAIQTPTEILKDILDELKIQKEYREMKNEFNWTDNELDDELSLTIIEEMNKVKKKHGTITKDKVIRQFKITSSLNMMKH